MDPELRSGQETYQYMELCRFKIILSAIIFVFDKMSSSAFVLHCLPIFWAGAETWDLQAPPLGCSAFTRGEATTCTPSARSGWRYPMTMSICHQNDLLLKKRLFPSAPTSQSPTDFFSLGSLTRSLPGQLHNCGGCCHFVILSLPVIIRSEKTTISWFSWNSSILVIVLHNQVRDGWQDGERNWLVRRQKGVGTGEDQRLSKVLKIKTED